MKADTTYVETFWAAFPRQHGAWAILAASLALGSAVGGALTASALWLTGAVLAGFFCREAAVLAAGAPAGSAPRLQAAVLAVLYGAFCGGSGLAAVAAGDLWLLVPIGAAGIAIAGCSVVLSLAGRSQSLLVDLLGLFGLSLVAAAQEYASAGEFTGRTLAVWLVCALYFLGRPLQVRYLTRCRASFGSLTARLQAGWPTLAWQNFSLGVAALLSAGQGALLPMLAPLAFLPPVLESAWCVLTPPSRALQVRTVGYLEGVHVALFTALTVLAFL